MRRLPSPVVLVIVLAVVLAACSSDGAAASATGSPGPASPSVSAGDLTIYGAASLKGALDKAKAAYEAANPGTTLVISTDSSSALETKIEQGAPADVFLSADTSNPKKLVDKGLAAGDPVHVRRQQADGHRPGRQPGRHQDAGRPRQVRGQGHRRRR